METKDEINEIKRLTEELNSLKLAYADLTVKHLCSETVIELGDELFNLDLKKKVRTRAFKVLQKKVSKEALSKYFGVCRQTYYNTLKASDRMEYKMIRDKIVVELVQDIRRDMPRLGAKKLYSLLKADCQQLGSIGRDKFISILRNNDLLVPPKKNYTKTTDSYHRFHKWSNQIKDITPSRPNEIWVSDITYLRTEEGFVYLFLVTDLYSRKIVGWSLSRSLSIEGAILALKMALRSRGKSLLSLTHHSDRGIQYCSKAYVEILEKAQVVISMTRENHCYENAVAERVNGILKNEFYLDCTFKSYAHALNTTKCAIQAYNDKRPHWSLSMQTPSLVYSSVNDVNTTENKKEITTALN